jgi:hypothetical protein
MRAASWIRERCLEKERSYQDQICDEEGRYVMTIYEKARNYCSMNCHLKTYVFSAICKCNFRFQKLHVDLDEAQTKYRLKKEAMEEMQKLEWACLGELK